MANTLLLAWNRVAAGCEDDAAKLYQSSLEYFAEQMVRGNIDSFEPVLLTPHDGDITGFFLVKASAAKLDAIRGTQDYEALVKRLALALDGFGVALGFHGDLLQQIQSQASC